MLTSITNFADQTFAIGARVRHSDGWTGTIIGIREQQTIDLLLVNPDPGADLRGYDKEVTLNPQAAACAGRPTYCRPRDAGRSMGNYTVISADSPKAIAATAFQSADDAWQACLETAFGLAAGDARYQTHGRGEEGTALRAAYEAREASRIAWEGAK